MAVKKYGKESNIWLSSNFKSNEFDCKGNGCCSETLVDDKLIILLQDIRNHFGKPIIINSGYRCNNHNKKVGGASGSYHAKGMAADIVVKDVKPAEVAKYAETIGVKGIGLYEDNDGNFVHIDTRTTKSFWYGHKQEKRTTFGGSAPKGNSVIKEWQKAAIADGFNLPSGADGIWGKECEAVAKNAVCKKRLTYKYKNLTKIVQSAVGVTADGKFGNNTRKAVISWQKLIGLTADGEIGINSWKKILGVKQ